MDDKWDNMRTSLESMLKRGILPQLNKDNAGQYLEGLNMSLSAVRPREWGLSDEPSAIQGVTTDGQLVIYSGSGRLPQYHAKPFAELHEQISGMVDEARCVDAKYHSALGEDVNKTLARDRAEKLQACEQLLADLEQAYEPHRNTA